MMTCKDSKSEKEENPPWQQMKRTRERVTAAAVMVLPIEMRATQARASPALEVAVHVDLWVTAAAKASRPSTCPEMTCWKTVRRIRTLRIIKTIIVRTKRTSATGVFELI